MAACRKLNSVLIVAPATMLVHWLTELKTWAPGLRRVLVHKSGEGDGLSRNISTALLRRLEKWLRRSRADCVNEAIDDQDLEEEFADHRFCGTGIAFVTTYESIRRTPEIWTAHNWSYALLDEGQKIRNPDADVTLSCKVCGCVLVVSLLSSLVSHSPHDIVYMLCNTLFMPEVAHTASTTSVGNSYPE